jgi:hypothetical protein
MSQAELARAKSKMRLFVAACRVIRMADAGGRVDWEALPAELRTLIEQIKRRTAAKFGEPLYHAD